MIGALLAHAVAALLAWATETSSPRAGPADAVDAALAARCGQLDGGLARVAREVAELKAAGLPGLDAGELAQAQRAAGEPHVWPRAWVVTGRALDRVALADKLAAWQRGFRDLGARRCGIASARTADGAEVLAAVAVDALADLDPLPVRARTGAWLALSARMLVPTTRARVLVMGPSGSPRTVPTSLEGDRVRARFALDRPGAFVVQVVADGPGGPRPVLEAHVFADVAPLAESASARAPGEEEAERDGATDEDTSADALGRMIGAVRAREHLGALRRDPRLDALARAHARRMREARLVAHDLGDGDPAQRLQAGDVVARETGENVAHARTVALAHRALHASPSHRANMLRGEYDRVGVSVALDANGYVWVAELFAGGVERSP